MPGRDGRASVKLICERLNPVSCLPVHRASHILVLATLLVCAGACPAGAGESPAQPGASAPASAGSEKERPGAPASAENEMEPPLPRLKKDPAGGTEKAEPQAVRGSHRVRMRLSGSTCVACIMDLEKKLRAMQGIVKVKIERPDQATFAYFGGPGASWSEATIVYDPVVVPLNAVTSYLRAQGFHPWKIVDRQGE